MIATLDSFLEGMPVHAETKRGLDLGGGIVADVIHIPKRKIFDQAELYVQFRLDSLNRKEFERRTSASAEYARRLGYGIFSNVMLAQLIFVDRVDDSDIKELAAHNTHHANINEVPVIISSNLVWFVPLSLRDLDSRAMYATYRQIVTNRLGKSYKVQN